MKLLFRRRVLGNIANVGTDQPWLIGVFTPTPAAGAFQDFFAWMVDENASEDEPPFDPDYWTDENWFVEDENGLRRAIHVPAVYEDGQIRWRWRES